MASDGGPAGAGRRISQQELPAPLMRDLALLADLLDQVLEEAGGPALRDDVAQLRRAMMDLRADPDPQRRRSLIEWVDTLTLGRAEAVARAFTLYLQLANLGEERHRVRALRERGRGKEAISESLEDTVAQVQSSCAPEVCAALFDRVQVHSVVTAHPTEARRRAVIETLERIGPQIDRLDDPRLTKAEEAEIRRRLLEEIAVLWRTAQLRREKPTPLDEVRTVMTIFDETIFRVVPMVYRELDRALDPEKVGARPSVAKAFLAWGSWVGGDRDGNPHVTAKVTRAAMDLHAEHALTGIEAVTRRIARSLTASAVTTPPSAELIASLEGDERLLPEVGAALLARSPREPHRRRLVLIAERLTATRSGSTGAYRSPAELLTQLRILQDSLAQAGAPRLAYGELQHLVWQVETFGFHLAALEIRQHSSVHARVLAELAPAAVGDLAALDQLARGGWPPGVRPRSAEALEALATLRVMADIQRRYGPDACRRYIVSFTRSAADLVTVRALARLAVPSGDLLIEVIPLFEQRADLDAATMILDDFLELPSSQAQLAARGRHVEVMLGYSDSGKELGVLAANIALHDAQARIAEWARRQDLELTLFHGRGGALGRGGGGPPGRAVLGQAPGSVRGRVKVTEQGESIFAHFGNIDIAKRHLEQMANAAMLSSTPQAEGAQSRRFSSLAGRLAKASEAAWRGLVESEGFAEFFGQVTPADELGMLQLGSRPSRRSRGIGLEHLRAIPWVFGWTQARLNLPGWYGVGSGLEAVMQDPNGLRELRRARKESPFLAWALDNAELSLAKTDRHVFELYLELGDRPDLSALIFDELERTQRLVLAVNGHTRLLQDHVVIRRGVELRNPYVDALSFLQLRFLKELRAGIADAEEHARVAELVLLTVNGVAAGVQSTG